MEKTTSNTKREYQASLGSSHRKAGGSPIERNSRGLYQCEECKLVYENPSWAKKCEKWCKAHKFCNLEITHHAAESSKNDIQFTETGLSFAVYQRGYIHMDILIRPFCRYTTKREARLRPLVILAMSE